jgi:hypothetical protein
MLKIGVIIPDLSSSQLAFFATQQINRIVGQSGDIDGVIFTERISKPAIPPACAVMSVSDIHNFEGILISTNLYNTKLSLKAVIPAKKIFYVWDLEWLRNNKKNDYIENLNILRDNEISIVSRSRSHANCFEKYTNRKSDIVVENFDIGRIVNEFHKR